MCVCKALSVVVRSLGEKKYRERKAGMDEWILLIMMKYLCKKEEKSIELNIFAAAFQLNYNNTYMVGVR